MVLRSCLQMVMGSVLYVSYSSEPFLNDMGWKDSSSRRHRRFGVTDWASSYQDGQEEMLVTFRCPIISQY